MATAAFKSNSKRSSNDKASSPKSNPNNKPENPKQKQRLRRSLSVSAVSRTTTTTCEEEFLNKRDNPLYWGSPEEADNKKNNNNTSEESKVVVVLQNVGQRGRSVVRNSGGQMEIGRRGRSVSRPRFPQSEAEQESRTEITYGGTSGSSSTGKLPVLGVKSFDRRSAHPSRHPSVGSSFDSQVSNWEDGISTSSLSEAEEKTIKAVYEQMKSLEGDNSRKDTTSSEIYETVRSEVRRAIADIQDDLQDCKRSTSTLTHGMPRWQSVCSSNQSNGHNMDPMIGKDSRDEIISRGACKESLDHSSQAYK
ncbi:hypothetical protein Tco_1485089 [Tanacetum coccineum]